jgi:hypothetical protein
VNRVRTAVVAVVASAAAASVTTVATAAPAKQHDESIGGTWTVYVTPSTDAPFESTMAVAPGGEVMEATSRAPMSAGGAWSHTGRGPIYVPFSKYRFDSAGNYIGEVTVHDVGRLSGTGDTHDGQATTVITNTAGVQVATFASVLHATRVTP